MYTKPTLERYGRFRDLTRLGLASATDGFSILGIGSSPGCETTWSYRGRTGTIEIGCPSDDVSTS